MLLKRSSPRIDASSVKPAHGLEHVKHEWIAVLRWLRESGVEYVVVGAAADSIRGNGSAAGPLAIVPAPYRRNLERLAGALASEHAHLRSEQNPENAALRLTAEKLAQRPRWELRCGTHDIDIDRAATAADDGGGTPSYQELLYESARFEPEPGLAVEVASLEDIEHFAHLGRTGFVPEIKITRLSRAEDKQPEQSDSA
jgi:hypothetical protein